MQRELLLLREMRDAAVVIRDLAGDRTAEDIDAEELRRSALLPARYLPRRRTLTLRSLGAGQPACVTGSFTATGTSTSRPW